MQEIIYNLIKNAICKYIYTPLKCSREDIILLSIKINLLLDDKKYEDDKKYDNDLWNNLFKYYLKIETNGELNNLTGYVKNHLHP